MIVDTDIDTTSTGYVRPDALTAVDAAMPKNTVLLGQTYDYDTHLWLPSVTVMGNHALGAYLYTEITKILGTVPKHGPKSTGDVAPLLALAAGLPLPNDDWYESFWFVGHLEIAALNMVFANGGFTVTQTPRTLHITIDPKES